MSIATLTWTLIALFPAAAAVAALVALSECRLALFVFGGLFILSTPNVGWPKLIYMSACLLACAIALFRADLRSAGERRLLSAAAIVGSIGLISFLVAFFRGIPLMEWFRAVVPTFLIALAPVFAIDSSKSSARMLIIAEFVVAGIAAGVAYAVQRNTRFVSTHMFWTLMMPAALFAYACAAAMTGRTYRLAWSAIAALVLIEMLLSAERSVWGILAIPLFVMTMRARPIVAELGGVVALGCLVAAGFILLLPTFTTMIGVRQDRLERRLFSVWAATTSPRSDKSNLLRILQTAQLAQAFARDPILGTGPGKVFPSVARGYLVMSTSVNDSPMEFPAKYGIVGVLLLLAAVVQVARFGRERARAFGGSPALRALAAYAIFALIASIAHSPIVDKGFAFGLAFLLALSLVENCGEPAGDSVVQR